MKITGKAKEDFFLWLYQEYDFTRITFNELYPVNLKESLIIEWLDSVGIYIEVGAICIYGYARYDYNIQENNTLNGMSGHTFSTRHEATQQAINKAIEIYNNR